MKPNLQKRPPNYPAAGGFGVLAATLRLGREFIGCDIAHHREDQQRLNKQTRPIAKRLATGISATRKPFIFA